MIGCWGSHETTAYMVDHNPRIRSFFLSVFLARVLLEVVILKPNYRRPLHEQYASETSKDGGRPGQELQHGGVQHPPEGHRR